MQQSVQKEAWRLWNEKENSVIGVNTEVVLSSPEEAFSRGVIPAAAKVPLQSHQISAIKRNNHSKCENRTRNPNSILDAVADDIVTVTTGTENLLHLHFVREPLNAIDDDAFISRPRLISTPQRQNN